MQFRHPRLSELILRPQLAHLLFFFRPIVELRLSLTRPAPARLVDLPPTIHAEQRLPHGKWHPGTVTPKAQSLERPLRGSLPIHVLRAEPAMALSAAIPGLLRHVPTLIDLMDVRKWGLGSPNPAIYCQDCVTTRSWFSHVYCATTWHECRSDPDPYFRRGTPRLPKSETKPEQSRGL